MTMTIPANLLPRDGRFGSGPSKLRTPQLAVLSHGGEGILGTSHRQEPVANLIARIQEQLLELMHAPDGYEIVLGNGGSTAFWDIAASNLIDNRAQCLDFGVFGRRFAQAAGTPWLEQPSVLSSAHGTLAEPMREHGIDVYAWPHNETSTGVLAPLRRVAPQDEALTVIDATSSAGGVDFDPTQVDAYYFAPQKNLGSDGALWVALLSPAAIERAERIGRSDRHIPAFLNLSTAIRSSRSHQTPNTPALATLLLLENQLDWILQQGGITWAEERVKASSQIIYHWAEKSGFATPFVATAEQRSPVNATIEFDPRVDSRDLARILRANGIVDVDPYSGVGTNQLRIATYVSIDPEDAQQLVDCIDYLYPRLAENATG